MYQIAVIKHAKADTSKAVLIPNRPARSSSANFGQVSSLSCPAAPSSLLVITGADVVTVLPRAIRAVRKSERLRGKNHSYRESYTH
jgi:hypothetical protein